MNRKIAILKDGRLSHYDDLSIQPLYNDDWRDRAFHESQQKERSATAQERVRALQSLACMNRGQPIIYTRYVYWRDWDGTTHGVMVDATSRYKATFGALRRAVLDGYTRPKWWQFWRWNEKNLWIYDCDHQHTSTFKAES